MYSVLWDFVSYKSVFVLFLTSTLTVVLLRKRASIDLIVHIFTLLPYWIYDKLRGTSTEQLCLEYVLANSREGDAESVLDTIDQFSNKRRWMMNIGREKRVEVVEPVVQQLKPKSVLELGTYCGYSAIAIARCLNAGSRIYSIEINVKNAAIAKRIITFSGLSDRIEVVEAASGDIVADVESKLGVAGGFDLVLLDHWKSLYVKDLKTLIEHNGLHRGSVVVADNIRFPGAPEYAKFIRNNTDFESKVYEVTCSHFVDEMEVSTYLPRNS